MLSEWLDDCTEKITVISHYESCRVDYCANPSQETKYDVLFNFIDECKTVIDEDDPIICDWEALSGLIVPNCKENQVYKGCPSTCDYKFCDNYGKSCNKDEIQPAGCVCKAGYVMFNGECVKSKDCPVGGDWTPWADWSNCDCGLSKIFRVRICLGPGDCPGESSESEDCDDPTQCGNFEWTTWSTFEDCTAQCDGGTKTRTRICMDENGNTVRVKKLLKRLKLSF